MKSNQTTLAYFEYSRDTPLFKPNSKFQRAAHESLLAQYIKKRSGKGLDGYEIDACIPLRMISFQRKKKFERSFRDRLTRGGKPRGRLD